MQWPVCCWRKLKHEAADTATTHLCGMCAGDLSQVQAQAQDAGGGGAKSGAVALGLLTAPRKASTDRAHLEANLAAAALLRSPAEYRRWLQPYVRHLAGMRPLPMPWGGGIIVAPGVWPWTCCYGFVNREALLVGHVKQTERLNATKQRLLRPHSAPCKVLPCAGLVRVR